MKWSFAAVGVIVLGIIGIAIIMLFQQVTTGNENDYYLLKEVTEAAMIEAIDISYYRDTGNLKIVKEKFVENFTRRFAESTLFIGTSYIISFFDIMEEPPKVTILINTGIDNYRIYNTIDDYNVQNNLTGIFEFIGPKTNSTLSDIGNKNNIYESKTLKKTYYSMPNSNSNGEFSITEPVNIPEELLGKEIENIKVTFNEGNAVNTVEEVLTARLKREIDWAKAADGSYGGTDYYNVIETEKLASQCDISNFKYYNCNEKKGKYFDKIDCNDKYNIWLHYDVKNCNKPNAIIKVDTTWSYDEYVY